MDELTLDEERLLKILEGMAVSLHHLTEAVSILNDRLSVIENTPSPILARCMCMNRIN